MDAAITICAGPLHRCVEQSRPDATAAKCRVDEQALELEDLRRNGPQGDTTAIVQQDTGIAARQLFEFFGEGLEAQVDSNIPLIILKELAYQRLVFREARNPDAKIKFRWVQRPKTPLLS